MYVKLKVFFEHLGKFHCLMELSSEMRQRTRVRPFRLKIFFAYKRNKANLDPVHMCFTISL